MTRYPRDGMSETDATTRSNLGALEDTELWRATAAEFAEELR